MKKIIIFIVCYLIGTIVYAQTPADSVPLDYNGLRETVYLQTSKGIYETGEDLWFKAYAFDAQTLALSDRSRTLFVEMADSRDSIVWQEKYPIHAGMAEGHIYVDKELRPGDYRIHAYTRHSFLRDTLMPVYPKVIRVVKEIADKLEHKETADKPNTVVRLRFFPEGGDLIDGIPSKVAFKATDEQGMSASAEGVLVEDGRVVAQLKSLHDGMGFFFLTPHKASSYKAVLDDGSEFPFCNIQTAGLSLRLQKQSDRYLDFQLSQPEDATPQTVRLVGRMRGMTCCTATATLHGSLRVRMPMETFTQQGIAEFTLYDGTGRPMAERLVYVHPQRQLYMEVKTDKIRYWKREKGTLKIRVTDEHGRPVQANLTLSLFDKAYVNEKVPENLLSYCFLSTEIRGNIHNPAYYFDERNKDRLESLDLLLLTQGWRRYVWEKQDTVTSAAVFLSDGINGVHTIGYKRKSQFIGDQVLMLTGPNKEINILTTDSTGHFTIYPNQLEMLRGGYVYVKSMLEREKYEPSISFEKSFERTDSLRKQHHVYQAYMTQLESIVDTTDHPIVGSDTSILLSEITVTAKGGRVYRDKFMGYLDSLAQIEFGPWVCCHGFLENYIDGYTHHHNPKYCPRSWGAYGDGEPRSVPIIGKRYSILKPEYFQCDGHDWCFRPLDHRTVVYEGPYYSEEELLRRNNYWRTKGYYGKREFYQPDIFDMRSSLPDARNTLLWLPNLMTDENGEAEAEFYCSDINTGFIGVVEGTDGQGLLGTGQCEFRVVRN